MSSALISLRAETCPHGRQEWDGEPPALTPLSRHERSWLRCPCRLSRHEHCLPSYARWARSSGTLRPQALSARPLLGGGAAPPNLCFSHQRGGVPASGGHQGPPDTRSRGPCGSLAFAEHIETQRARTESDFPMECSRTCHFNMPQGESWARGSGSERTRRI